MSKGHKRIVLILIGVLLTAGSLIWMTYIMVPELLP